MKKQSKEVSFILQLKETGSYIEGWEDRGEELAYLTVNENRAYGFSTLQQALAYDNTGQYHVLKRSIKTTLETVEIP